jgi:hypothetical protein
MGNDFTPIRTTKIYFGRGIHRRLTLAIISSAKKLSSPSSLARRDMRVIGIDTRSNKKLLPKWRQTAGCIARITTCESRIFAPSSGTSKKVMHVKKGLIGHLDLFMKIESP